MTLRLFFAAWVAGNDSLLLHTGTNIVSFPFVLYFSPAGGGGGGGGSKSEVLWVRLWTRAGAWDLRKNVTKYTPLSSASDTRPLCELCPSPDPYCEPQRLRWSP